MTLPSFRSASPTTTAGEDVAAMVLGVRVTLTRSTPGTPVMNEQPAAASDASARPTARAPDRDWGRRSTAYSSDVRGKPAAPAGGGRHWI
jgi:hypothetical protein